MNLSVLPSGDKINQLRLILSTFRDGSGQEQRGNNSYPGWRDFERSTATWLKGRTTENKAVFDVLVDDYGVSCKMSTSTKPDEADHVLMEITNSQRRIWDHLNSLSIDPVTHPERAGPAIVSLVKSWHVKEVSNLDQSVYLSLVHDPSYTKYRLHAFSLDCGDPHSLRWVHRGKSISAFAEDRKRAIWQWYGWSGGQLKYLPQMNTALWSSHTFTLNTPLQETLLDKTRRLWGELAG
jgi:hypothetical protein